MARSFQEAFAAVDGPKLDFAIGLTTRPWPRRQAPKEVEVVFERFDFAHVHKIERRLCAEFRCHVTYAEEAVQEAQLKLLEDRPELFRQDPRQWLKLLYAVARLMMHSVTKPLFGAASLEQLSDAVGERAFVGAEPCVAPTGSADEDCRYEPPPPLGEAWTRSQVIGALQRFRDHHGRPPRARECRALNQLPTRGVIVRLFGDFRSAILAAGMVPPTLGARFKRWTPHEAALACHSFRRRNGRWPDGSDADRRASGLPNRRAMIRFFGGTTAGEVQRGAEAILADGAPGRIPFK